MILHSNLSFVCVSYYRVLNMKELQVGMDETWITRASDRIPSESYFLCVSGSFKKDRRKSMALVLVSRKAHILRYPFPRKIESGVSTEYLRRLSY